jgi:hypothetical protein
MSQRDDRVRLRHMLDYAQEALALTSGKQRADLVSDHVLELALTRLLEILGEAANQVSEESQKQRPQIPWREIVGLRHREDKVRMIPPGLKASEAHFVRDLRAYWTGAKDEALEGKEVFLLRNLSRGSGIGFFEERGFYPDFILWVTDGRSQRIVYVEPHGMLYAKAYTHDEKARLHERWRSWQQRWGGEASGRTSPWIRTSYPPRPTTTCVNATTTGRGTDRDSRRSTSSSRNVAGHTTT